MLGYRIELYLDDNGTVLVTCPDLPEVTTFAASEAEARCGLRTRSRKRWPAGSPTLSPFLSPWMTAASLRWPR